MAASSSTKVKLNYSSLLDIAKMEFLRNESDYKVFFEEGVNIRAEVDKVIKERNYECQIADMMCNILSNSTQTSVMIWTSAENKSLIQSIYIQPTRGPLNGIIHIHKSGQHYEPIVNFNMAG